MVTLKTLTITFYYMIYGFRAMFNRNVETMGIKKGGLTYVNRLRWICKHVIRIFLRFFSLCYIISSHLSFLKKTLLTKNAK